MPHEAVLLSSEPITIVPILEAAARVTEHLFARTLFHRAVLQLTDENGTPVLSVQNSLRVLHPDEISRLLLHTPTVAGDIWWTEAFFPWSDEPYTGEKILRELARQLDADLVMEKLS